MRRSRFGIGRALSTATAAFARGGRRHFLFFAVFTAVVAASMVPALASHRWNGSLSLDGEARPGERVTVRGTGFADRDRVRFRWDDESVSWIDPVETNRNGDFVVKFKLPASIEPGVYELAAVKDAGRDIGRDSKRTAVLDVTVLAGESAAVIPSETPQPTEKPDPTQAPTEEPAPALAPTEAPDPTATATPSPTASPTPTAATQGTTAGHADPRVNCEGYPEPRVFLETQDWWEPIPVLNTLGHVHLGMCFPVGQTVSGIVEFDLRVILHDNKGTLSRVKQQDDKSDEHLLLFPDLTPPDGGLREFWFEGDIDTSAMADGMRTFRWYADVEHVNGNTQTARMQLPLNVQNGGGGGGEGAESAGEWRFMNWYRVASPNRDWGYVGPVIDQIPLTAVSGTWQVEINCAVNGDGNSPGIHRSLAHIDPAFHAMPPDPGTTVLDVEGAHNGTVDIDTTGLANGPHKLAVRCQQVDGEELHEGVGVIPFVVEN
ncbi:MAG: hypothetical protein ACRDG7_02460 [Candidatus Limnocylindria bacterium]